MVQNIAFILIGIGVLSLAGWALQAFFSSSEVHILIRIAVGAISLGALILVLIAIKDRLKKGKKDEFKEVER
ncbi:hypothetical protein ACFLTB_04600 [Chloroflexota bacterium]